MTQQTDGFDEAHGGVIIDGPLALSPETHAEVDIQITTAKRYPRSIKSFREQALAMATIDEDTAAGCFYSLPRGGKPIEGPSARLAEIVLSAWGNVRSDAKVVAVSEKEITAEAMTWDLEKNVAIRVQVKRRITGRDGKRYNDDMIAVTGNAAISIALRNSVFKVIPNVFTKQIYLAARQTAIGDAKTLTAKRAEMIDYFAKMGVSPDRIFAAIGKGNVDDIGLDELATLKGVATAIKDGDVSVDEAFPPVIDTSGPAGVGGLKDRLSKTPAETKETVQDKVQEAAPPETQTDEDAERAAIEAEGKSETAPIDPKESKRQDLIQAIKDKAMEIAIRDTTEFAKLIGDFDFTTATQTQLKDKLASLGK